MGLNENFYLIKLISLINFYNLWVNCINNKLFLYKIKNKFYELL